MKKLILFFFIAGSISLVNAQKVVGIYFINQSQAINLDGLSLYMPSNPPANLTFPLLVVYQNTGDVINAGDSMHMSLIVEGQNMLNLKITFNEALETDSVSMVNLQNLSVPTSTFKATNTWCFGITKAYRSGVETTYSDTLCATFTTQTTGVSEISTIETVIYPNPAKDILYIDNAENADIYIYNTIGQIVKKVTNVLDKSEINISDLNNGMYIVRIQRGQSVQTQKIQIIK
ncbi:MAG: T9SS type A sorting domain-containing protein [Bacteroidales bacterium]|jgi:hypothetical protein